LAKLEAINLILLVSIGSLIAVVLLAKHFEQNKKFIYFDDLTDKKKYLSNQGDSSIYFFYKNSSLMIEKSFTFNLKLEYTF